MIIFGKARHSVGSLGYQEVKRIRVALAAMGSGIDGLKHYVALSVLARNRHRLGTLLQEQARRQHDRYRKVA